MSSGTIGFSFLCGIEDGPPDAEFLLFTTPKAYRRPLGVVNLPRNRENRCPKSVSRRETPPPRQKDDRLAHAVILR